MKKIITFILLLLLLTACQKPATSEDEEVFVPKGDHPKVTMTLMDGSIVEMELYPEVAPNTVNNFIQLIESSYYDGLTFHRIIDGFMIQGGDPQGNGGGGPGYTIPGEFSSNGHKNNLAHTRGVLSMARAQSPNSAGSQFFIMHQDAPWLDGEYAAFGQVTQGLDVVDRLAKVEVLSKDKPKEDVVIYSMRVDLNGYIPEKIIKS